MTMTEEASEEPNDGSMRDFRFKADSNEVVISGMSCRLPDADNMTEFGNILRQSDNDNFSGCLKDLDKFDAEYFGIPPKQANVMDPQVRKMLEGTCEAIVDAGVDPATLRGSKTGVFIGLDISHAHEAFGTNPEDPQGYAAWGCTKSMFANRLSFSFDFRGPSYGLQGSDASGSLALDQAYHSMKNGEIDSAVVVGTNLCLKVKRLDPTISDAVIVMFLQRYSQAKRVYATVLYTKAQISSQKAGLDYPNEQQQITFLNEVYQEAELDPETVEYVECHSTYGIHELTSEVKAIKQVLCKDRETPLLIGSVMSHVGDTASASGLVAVAKILLAFEDGMISSTINQCPYYSDSNKLQVVTENTRTYGGYYGINTLGKGGYHAHTIVVENSKTRILHYVASQRLRLCIYASRTDEGIHNVLRYMQKHQDDMELHALLNQTAQISPASLPNRGYCLLNSTDHSITTQVCPRDGDHRPVWFVMSGMGSQWPGMGRTMMELEIFRQSIHESSDVLQQFGINLYKIIMFGDEHIYDKPLNSFIGITAIQIALVKVLQEVGIKPDGLLGHSIGEIACAYADGCLTAKEAMLTAYWRGYCVQESNLSPGLMAAVGLTWKEAIEQCPSGVVPACHNSKQTVTISGEAQKVEQFLTALRNRQTFVKEVNTAGVAFHSHHMITVGEKLRDCLKNVCEKSGSTLFCRLDFKFTPLTIVSRMVL